MLNLTSYPNHHHITMLFLTVKEYPIKIGENGSNEFISR